MTYEVKIDFGDNAVQQPKRFDSAFDLSLYLERIPSMIGFDLNRGVTISIESIASNPHHQFRLPIENLAV